MKLWQAKLCLILVRQVCQDWFPSANMASEFLCSAKSALLFFLDIANLEVSHCPLLALTKTMKLIFSIQFPLLQIIMTNLFSGSVHTGGGCLLPLHVNDNLAWYRIHWLPCIYF